MKVLLDEMLPAGVAGLLPDHAVTTAQNITAIGIAIVLVRGSRMPDLTDQAPAIQASVAEARPGTVTRVERR